MLSTCEYAMSMPKMVQIRNMPDELHGQLKARAALAGMSLSDYLLQELRQSAERPTMSELRERIAGRKRVSPTVSPADAVRAERERR